jgi:superoxide reductase
MLGGAVNELFFGVNRPRSNKPEDMSDLEKRHVPVIEIKSLDDGLYEVTVETGEWLAHSMEQAHFIEWMELYVNNTLIARMEFTPEITKPVMRVILKAESGYELFAKERCNLHGTWMSEIYRI